MTGFHGDQAIRFILIMLALNSIIYKASHKRAPRIFIFSIVLGAENLSYMKFIKTHAHAFLALIILSRTSVHHICLDGMHVW